jgi:hypothetical protein
MRNANRELKEMLVKAALDHDKMEENRHLKEVIRQLMADRSQPSE